MAGEDSIGTREQQEYLRSALAGLPEQLIEDYGGEEAVVEAAFAESEQRFEEAAPQWEDLRKAEARVKRMYSSSIGRALIGITRSAGTNIFISTLLLLGAALVASGYLDTARPRIGGVLAFEIAMLGLLVLVAPALLRWCAEFFPELSERIRVRTLGMARLFQSQQQSAWAVLSFGVSAYLIWFLEPAANSLIAAGAASIFAGISVLVARELIGRLLLEELRIAEEAERASRLAFIRQLRMGSLGRLRAKLSNRRSYATDLRYNDYSGLAEMNDAGREVPTATRDRVIEIMRLMPGGTIAFAGARGAGKSTLMRSVCKAPSTRRKQQDPLHVIVDAPVQYEARDFVLHLFARLCTAVVGEDEVRKLRGSDRLLGSRATSSRILFEDPQLLVGVFCIASGFLLALGALMGFTVASPLGWGVILLLGGYLIAFPRYASGRRMGSSSEIEGPESSTDANVHTAIRRLRQIWFQQSFSQGWSGGFKAPVGIEGGLSGSTELAEQQLSLPDIVDLFREFLSQVAAGREVRIGIDELDKMDDESARRFLNELKVVFRVTDCFFFLSISEEAMSYFERRGLHVRDVFDSSLDAVIQVPHLRFEVSRELLELRIVQLPFPFAALLHCLSGGLPRDLIRAARDLVELEEGTSLTDAATRLLRAGMRAKVDAAKVACRVAEMEESSFALTDWIDRLDRAKFDPEGLLHVCREFDGALLPAETRALGAQLAAFAYYAATLLGFFEKFSQREYAEEAIAGDPEGSRHSLVDRLAAANQALSSSAGAGWEAITDFRAEAGLEGSVPSPARPSAVADEVVPAVS